MSKTKLTNENIIISYQDATRLINPKFNDLFANNSAAFVPSSSSSDAVKARYEAKQAAIKAMKESLATELLANIDNLHLVLDFMTNIANEILALAPVKVSSVVESDEETEQAAQESTLKSKKK